jgi:hypothetical protein
LTADECEKGKDGFDPLCEAGKCVYCHHNRDCPDTIIFRECRLGICYG